MYNDIYSLFTSVCFYKMVASSKCSQRKLRSAKVDPVCTSELAKVDLSGKTVGLAPYRKSRGYLCIYELVKLHKLNISVFKKKRFHSAADIHAHKVRHYFIGNSHGRSDNAALSRMNIGHYPELCSKGEFLTAQGGYLRD